MEKDKIIFLDFDGVLHIDGGVSFGLADYFASVIHKNKSIKIVFSTSWREYSNLEKLKLKMPNSIKDQCIGLTPVLPNQKHVRFEEIQSYLKENNLTNNLWVAIDDMDCLFPKNCANLILTNPRKGFSIIEANILKQRFSL